MAMGHESDTVRMSFRVHFLVQNIPSTSIFPPFQLFSLERRLARVSLADRGVVFSGFFGTNFYLDAQHSHGNSCSEPQMWLSISESI